MKKYLFLLLSITLILSSCQSISEKKETLKELEKQETLYENSLQVLKIQVSNLTKERDALEEEIYTFKQVKTGKTPVYMLKMRLKQTHFTLDIEQHMKDEMNAIEFELPVDKEFYQSVNTGTDIVDSFRWGSLIMNGSFGDWDMEVKRKYIIYK